MEETAAILKCQSGDPRAFQWIYERYGQPLFATAQRMLGDVSEAEDAVQNTFIRVYKNIRGFKMQSKFSTWLFKIHIRVCLDLLAKRRPVAVDPLDHRFPVSTPDHALRLTLDQAIASLPEQQRACFILYHIAELPQEDIAKSLQLSVGGVKSNIFHAKMKLRDYLAPQLKE